MEQQECEDKTTYQKSEEKLEDWKEKGYDWGSRINYKRISENEFGKLTLEKVHAGSEMQKKMSKVKEGGDGEEDGTTDPE